MSAALDVDRAVVLMFVPSILIGFVCGVNPILWHALFLRYIVPTVLVKLLLLQLPLKESKLIKARECMIVNKQKYVSISNPTSWIFLLFADLFA